MANNIAIELYKIQQKLKAPKNQRNSFGKYNYRSCEDILEAVKPLLEQGIVLTLDDTMVAVGDRVYVKATATLSDGDNGVTVNGWAREAVTKKGMDDAQITGAASSYARKYALNGLFCIDDTKDSDANNTHGNEPKKAQVNKELKAGQFVDNAIFKITGYDNDQLDVWKEQNAKAIESLTKYPEQQEKLQAAIMAKYKELENA